MSIPVPPKSRSRDAGSGIRASKSLGRPQAGIIGDWSFASRGRRPYAARSFRCSGRSRASLNYAGAFPSLHSFDGENVNIDP